MEIIGTVSKLKDVYLTLKGILIALAAVKCILIFQQQQDKEQPMSVAMDKCTRVVKAVAIGILSTDIVQTLQKYWTRTSGSGTRFFEHLVSGFNLLIEDVKGTLILLDASLTAFFIIKNLMMASKSEDDEKTMYKRKAAKNLVVGIGILGVYALVVTILNYFA